MRADHLRFLVNALRWFTCSFSNCRLNVSMCNPYRSGFLSGLYAINSGVYDHSAESTTAANGLISSGDSLLSWLAAAGTEVGFVGKTLIGQANSAMPGVDYQRTFTGATEQASYGVVGFDGTSTDTPPADIYTDDYLAARSATFIENAVEPFFLWVAPSSPHVDGSTFQCYPAVEDVHAWDWYNWPIAELTDTTGKPSWISALPPLTPTAKKLVREAARSQLKEIASIDRLVVSLFSALQTRGVLGNTDFIFTTDNGIMYGEQRLDFLFPADKNKPYDPSCHVPLVAVGPSFPSGAITVPVCSQDITAYAVAAHGATPTVALDGVDLSAIAASPGDYASRATLLERSAQGGDIIPSGNGVQQLVNGDLWKLFTYPGESSPDDAEMHNVTADPNEFVNLAADSGSAGVRSTLEASLAGMVGG